jgi:predicted RNA-binding Zn-ribbon protein involved in translation (DUF1610 family)
MTKYYGGRLEPHRYSLYDVFDCPECGRECRVTRDACPKCGADFTVKEETTND